MTDTPALMRSRRPTRRGSARAAATAPSPIPSRRRLRAQEHIRLAGEILAAYLEVRRLMRQAPIEDVVRSLRGDAGEDPTRGSRDDVLYESWRLGRAVRRTLRLAPGDTRCLTQSLVLTRMLARRGIPSRLVIAAGTQPSFFAHAWVEQAGEPVLSVGDDAIGRLVEL